MKKNLLSLLFVVFSTSVFAQIPLGPQEVIKSYYTSDLVECRGGVKLTPNGLHFTLGATYDLNEVLPLGFRGELGRASGIISNTQFIGGATARSSKVEANYTATVEDILRDSAVVVLDWRRIGTNNTSTIEFIIRFTGPFVDAGKDMYECGASQFEVLTNYQSKEASNFLWTSTGSQSVFHQGLSGAMYTPNQTDITNGYAEFVVSTNESKISCINDSDTLRVYFDLEPTITKGEPFVDNFGDDRIALRAQPDGYLDYIWYSGNTTTVLGTGRDYLAFEGGDVRLEVTSASCNETTVADLVTGLNVVTTGEVTVYPNPTSSQVTMRGAEALQLMDLTGVIIMEESSSTLDLSEVDAGSYILRGTTDSGIKTTSITVVK